MDNELSKVSIIVPVLDEQENILHFLSIGTAISLFVISYYLSFTITKTIIHRTIFWGLVRCYQQYYFLVV